MKIFLSALFIHVCAISFAQTWTNFNTSNSGLLNNYVSCITVDKLGNIYVGYGGIWNVHGFQKYDGSNWIQYTVANSPLPNDDVRALNTDSYGNIWIGTNGGGLVKFDGVNWTVYDTSNSDILYNSIGIIKIDTNNIIWMNHTIGVSEFDGVNFKTYYYPKDSALKHNCVSEFYFDDSTFVWMGAGCSDGIIRLNRMDSTWFYLNSSNSNMPSSYVSSINKDKSGNLWIGYYLGYYGVSKYDGNIVTNYTPFTSQAWVWELAADTNGNVFVGTRSKGLYKYDGSNWSLVPSPLPDSGTTSLVYRDRYNRIWWGEQFTGLWVSDIGNAVNEIKNGEIGLNIYPNPINTQFTLSLPTPLKSDATIFIRDLSSRQLKKETLQKQTAKKEIDISELSAGIYFLTLQTQSGSITKKLVKQ